MTYEPDLWAMLGILAVLCAAPTVAQVASDDLLPQWNEKAAEEPVTKTDIPPTWAVGEQSDNADRGKPELPDAWSVSDIAETPAAASKIDDLVATTEPLIPADLMPAAPSMSGPLDQVTLERVRTRLRALGLLANADDSENGFVEAIRRYQNVIKLQETGNLDRDTLGRLLTQ